MEWFIIFALAFGLHLATATSTYDYYRLPTALWPRMYELKILTRLENPEDLNFSGSVSITLEPLENTKNITLHSKNLKIDESRTTLVQLGEKAKANCINSTSLNEKHDYYILYVCEELQVGIIYQLTLWFSGELNKKLSGYYRSSYTDSATKKERWLSVTQFEPSYARTAFPCFDEPHFKSTFAISLGHPQNYTALSNMPLKFLYVDDPPLYIFSKFEDSVPMSTYLVAYSINDFRHKPSTLTNGTLFRTWARPDAIDQCDFAAEFGPKVLRYFENFFGLKYPLPQLDQIAIPDLSAGAMENWGLVTYRETALLYSINRTSVKAKETIATTISHELAHQWFGNLVTMKWWSDLWLNEGFATYVAKLGIEGVHPEWKTKDRIYVQDLLTTFRLDALESSHPISRPIQSVSDIGLNFDAISYKKGAVVIRMMHLFMGEKSFYSGLKSYLELYAYKNAEQDDLWKSLSKAAHQFGSLPKNYDIKTIMDSWTLQTGFPVINITRDYSKNTATLSQERYLLNTQIPHSQRKGCWWLPLSYTTQSKKNFNDLKTEAWLECEKNGNRRTTTVPRMPKSDQWVIFNKQMSTLCKINYDVQNWKLIIKTLKSNRFQNIHPINRAQLIEDIMHFARTGEQDYSLALQLLSYLKRERSYLPWFTALSNLGQLSNVLFHTESYEIFKFYVQNLITPIYNYLKGMDDNFKSLKSPDQILLKTLILSWACRYEVLDCVPKAQAYYRRWESEMDPDKNNPIPTNLRGIVLCTAARSDKLDFLWKRYNNTNVAAERSLIISSASCSVNETRHKLYLDYIFRKNFIRQQDSLMAFNAIAVERVGFPIAKKYFIDNVEAIYKYYYPSTRKLSNLLSILPTQLTERKDLDEFKEFFKKSKKFFVGLEDSVQKVLENILINVQWMERRYETFFEALLEHI
ncbi:aminopeptidase N-like [Drosophila bipectinata]|uniref:aminopeptidase N-like n=1 Tax=Drosophila bipectinata TaxID=42026 RepID=UPI001C893E74|nr:aminopeptidase N-like [Drosophila bipectinata]